MSLVTSNRRRALLTCLAALACASVCARFALAQGLRQVGNDAFGMTIEEVEPRPTGIRVKVLIENLTSSQEIFLHHEPNQLNAQDFFFLPAARRNRGSTRDTFVLRVAPAGTASADLFFPIEPGKNPGLLVLGSRRPPFEQVAVALGPILKGRPPDEVADASGLVEPLAPAPPERAIAGARPAPHSSRPPTPVETRTVMAPSPETPPTATVADRPEATGTGPQAPPASLAPPAPPAAVAEAAPEPPAAPPSPDGIVIELAEAPPADGANQPTSPTPQAPAPAVPPAPARATLQAPAPPAPQASAPPAPQAPARAAPQAPAPTVPQPPAPAAPRAPGLAAKPKAPFADTPRASAGEPPRPQARPGGQIAVAKPPAEPLYTPPGAPPQTRWIPVDDGPVPRPEFTTPPGAPPQTRWIPVDDRPALSGSDGQPSSRPAVGPRPEIRPKSQVLPQMKAQVPPPQTEPQARPQRPAQQAGQPRPIAQAAIPQAPATARPKPRIVFLPNTPGDRVLQIYNTPHASLGEKLVLRQGRTGRGGYGWSRIRSEHPDVGGPDIAMAATYPHQVWSDGRTLLYLRWSEEQNGAIVLQVAGDLIVNAQWASYDELLYWLGPGRIYPRLLYQGAR